MFRSVVALLATIAVSGVAVAQDADAEMRFGAGVRLLRDGFPDRALIELEAALKKDPGNAFYLKGISVAYSQLADRCKPNDTGCRTGNLKKAIENAQKALVANPDYVDARNDLGIALLRLGKRTDGKAELAKAFADPQCPTPEVTAWNLGTAFFEEKEYNEAMTWFQAALNKNKSLAAGYVSIADILLILGQTDAAVVQLETGMKETGDNASVQLSLGDAYLKAGRFQDARAAYEGVIKKDPAGAAGRQAVVKLKSIQK
jgi:tetratricopeptide (TPR) repeat protein